MNSAAPGPSTTAPNVPIAHSQNFFDANCEMVNALIRITGERMFSVGSQNVYMYVRTHIYMYIYNHVFVHIFVHIVYAYIYILYVYIYTYIYANASVLRLSDVAGLRRCGPSGRATCAVRITVLRV